MVPLDTHLQRGSKQRDRSGGAAGTTSTAREMRAEADMLQLSPSPSSVLFPFAYCHPMSYPPLNCHAVSRNFSNLESNLYIDFALKQSGIISKNKNEHVLSFILRISRADSSQSRSHPSNSDRGLATLVIEPLERNPYKSR